MGWLDGGLNPVCVAIQTCRIEVRPHGVPYDVVGLGVDGFEVRRVSRPCDDGERKMPKALMVAAAGRVSRRVAAALCDRGEPPRALVRDAAKAREVLVDNRGAPLPLEIVASDIADRDGVRRALVGIEIAFLALGSSLQQVELEQRFIDVAAEVGLPHLVKRSAAEARSDGVASVLRWHAAIESHLAAREL